MVSAGIIERFGLQRLCVGRFEAAAAGGAGAAEATAGDAAAADAEEGGEGWTKPPLEACINLFDFEEVARRTMNRQGWAYYSSGADDEITLRENHAAFQRIWLKPRVLVDVSEVDLSCTMFGHTCSLPVYITATALGKLAHPDGELALLRAAAAQDVVYMLPTLSSYPLDDMLAARAPGQVNFLQLYVNGDRKVSEEYVRRAEAGGCSVLCVTVDAPQLGRREKDMRHRFTLQGANVQKKDDSKGAVDRNQGTARAISQFIDPSLAWKDVAWLRSITKMKIVLKGIQCGEDAALAARAGVDGIIVSNHGGRQMDFGRSAIEVLPEVMDALREEGAGRRVEVLLDGGVRRGTDIYKALALGAKAVGIGRPALYGLAGYGQQGVERVLQCLREELLFTMRLMGKQRISDIGPDSVCTRNLPDHFAMQARDYLAERTYEPLMRRSRL